MVFSFLRQRKDKEDPTPRLMRILERLRTQQERRPFNEVEGAAATALGLLKYTGLDIEAGEEMINFARKTAHRVSAGAIFNDLDLQERPFASLEEVNRLETEAYDHLRDESSDETLKEALASAALGAAIEEAAERTRNRVRAEQICENLAASEKPLAWKAFVTERIKFKKFCIAAGLSLKAGSDYAHKFAESTAEIHRISVEDLLDELRGEGKAKYLEDIHDMAADICCHMHALDLNPVMMEKELDEIVSAVNHAGMNNTAGHRPRPASVKHRTDLGYPGPNSGSG